MAHRQAGDFRTQTGRHTRGAGETERQQGSVASEEDVGAAKDGILLMQHHHRPTLQQPCRQHRGDGRIAAEANHGGGVQHGKNPSRLQHAGGQRGGGLRGTHGPAPGNARAPDYEAFGIGEHAGRQPGRPRIRHQRYALPARQQLGGQCFGGEEMPARAASGDDDGMDGCTPHPLPPSVPIPCRRRVRANNMPMPSAIASAEDPP